MVCSLEYCSTKNLCPSSSFEPSWPFSKPTLGGITNLLLSTKHKEWASIAQKSAQGEAWMSVATFWAHSGHHWGLHQMNGKGPCCKGISAIAASGDSTHELLCGLCTKQSWPFVWNTQSTSLSYGLYSSILLTMTITKILMRVTSLLWGLCTTCLCNHLKN